MIIRDNETIKRLNDLNAEALRQMIAANEEINRLLGVRIDLLERAVELEQYNTEFLNQVQVANYEKMEFHLGKINNWIRNNTELAQQFGLSMFPEDLTESNWLEFMTWYENVVKKTGGAGLAMFDPEATEKAKQEIIGLEATIRSFFVDEDPINERLDNLFSITDPDLFMQEWNKILPDLEAYKTSWGEGTEEDYQRFLDSLKAHVQQMYELKGAVYDATAWEMLNTELEKMGVTAEEIDAIFYSIAANQLNIYNLRKKIGLVKDESPEKELEYVNEAIDAYLERYNIQKDFSELTDDEIMKLLETANYNEDLINLMTQRNNLQKSINEGVAGEISGLRALNNERINQLLDELDRLDLMVQKGQITKTQAAILREQILQQILGLAGGAGASESLLNKVAIMIAENAREMSGENVGGTGEVATIQGVAQHGIMETKEGIHLLHDAETVAPKAVAEPFRNMAEFLTAQPKILSIQSEFNELLAKAVEKFKTPNITLSNIQDYLGDVTSRPITAGEQIASNLLNNLTDNSTNNINIEIGEISVSSSEASATDVAYEVARIVPMEITRPETLKEIKKGFNKLRI